mmetsp:Transcript_45354/g.84581  ORF Transcript_45354/g.84581 Transcript_45354/m.84581 type:complete len:637 (-) Transcript_45354:150-2060(-)
MGSTRIRAAEEKDFPDIIKLARQVAEEPDAFLFDEDYTTEELESQWLPEPSEHAETFVLEADGFDGVMGVYVIHPAAHGRGAHIAHGLYMVAQEARGRGFGKALCSHSVARATEQGYHGMRINMVVASNHPARSVCAACGFQVLCTLPRGFRHPQLGLVDTMMMFHGLNAAASEDRPSVSVTMETASAALQVGQQVGLQPISISGSGKVAVEIHPALPEGLKICPLTGTISGTPVSRLEEISYCVKAVVSTEFSLRVEEAADDVQCEKVSMSINEDFATLVESVHQIEHMLPEPCKTRAYGDWMIWMVHRVWLNDPCLTDLNFSNMHMPPPHIEKRIAPKLMEALLWNCHLESLTLSNSNLVKASGVQLAHALRSNQTLQTLNLESNWLDSNAVRELALAIKDNQSCNIEFLRFSHQKQMGQFFGRPTEEAVGQMMQHNDMIVKLGFECDDAHWRNEIDRALLRNNDSWRRRQAPPDTMALPTAEAHSLGRIHLIRPPEVVGKEVLGNNAAVCNYLDHNKKLPTTSQLQNCTKNSGRQISYAKAAPMIKEFRSWMLDGAVNQPVEVFDTFETATYGILRQWSASHDHWTVEVLAEDKRYTFHSSRDPALSVSEEWASALRNRGGIFVGLPETQAGA